MERKELIPKKSEPQTTQSREELTPYEEYKREMEKKNYLRAEYIAREYGLGEEKIEEARIFAIKQFLKDYNSFVGAKILIKEWGWTKEKLFPIVKELEEEIKREEERVGREIMVFDIKLMKHKNIKELIERFLKEI